MAGRHNSNKIHHAYGLIIFLLTASAFGQHEAREWVKIQIKTTSGGVVSTEVFDHLQGDSTADGAVSYGGDDYFVTVTDGYIFATLANTPDEIDAGGSLTDPDPLYLGIAGDDGGLYEVHIVEWGPEQGEPEPTGFHPRQWVQLHVPGASGSYPNAPNWRNNPGSLTAPGTYTLQYLSHNSSNATYWVLNDEQDALHKVTVQWGGSQTTATAFNFNVEVTGVGNGWTTADANPLFTGELPFTNGVESPAKIVSWGPEWTGSVNDPPPHVPGDTGDPDPDDPDDPDNPDDDDDGPPDPPGDEDPPEDEEVPPADTGLECVDNKVDEIIASLALDEFLETFTSASENAVLTYTIPTFGANGSATYTLNLKGQGTSYGDAVNELRLWFRLLLKITVTWGIFLTIISDIADF